jgi:lysophospholipase L1-like esterase
MAAPARRMTVLALGQSNIANHGPERAKGGPGALMLTEKKGLVPMQDPLPGATGDGGSVWTRFAPLAIKRGLCDEIAVIAVAAENTTVADWMQGAKAASRLDAALDAADTCDAEITHIVWHQGERDTQINTPGGAYARYLTAVIGGLRMRGLDVPVIVCNASYLAGATSESVRLAQQAVVNPIAGVYAGPDTDAIGAEHRFDDCHFDAKGQKLFAEALVKSLSAIERGLAAA